MAVRRIVIHAGHQKTGTTSIQRTLHAGRDKLRRLSVYYPDESPNHVFLVSAFHQNPAQLRSNADIPAAAVQARDERMLDGLASFLKKTDCRTALFSSELLQALDQDAMVRMRDFFARITDDLMVVIYVRHPVAYSQSWAQERVKQGAESLQRLVQRAPCFPYAEKLPQWVNAFGRERIVLRPFETARFKNGDLIEDFIDVCGLPPIAEWGTPMRVRESLSLPALMLANQLKLAGNGPLHPRTTEVLAEIEGARFALPPESLDDVRAKSAADLAYLREEFGIDLADPGDEGIVYRRGNIFSPEAMRSIAGVLDRLARENAELRRQLKGGKKRRFEVL